MLNLLFSSQADLKIDGYNIGNEQLEIVACRTTEWAECPQCQTKSHRKHSTYRRRPADLPCIGYKVVLSLAVKRFFCDNNYCSKKTFAEQYSGLLKRWAHRTDRLLEQQLAVGFELGGEAGRRVLLALKMPISADTIIADLRRTPDYSVQTPRVLGIDDWAKCKGTAYGTILVDLERGIPIDLLDGRDAKTVEAWLADHQNIEIVSRDRSKEYKKAITTALPEATQVADRWHLLKNLRDAVEVFVRNKPACLHAAAKGAAPCVTKTVANSSAEKQKNAPQSEIIPTKAPDKPLVKAPTKAAQIAVDRRARREERFEHVRTLYQSGCSMRAISRKMKMSTRTVRKYILADKCPQYPKRGARRNKLTPFLSYLETRWQQGMTNGTQLWRELRDDHQYTGSRSLVSRWAASQRKLLPQPLQYARQQTADVKPPISRLIKPAPWTARAVSWLLFHEESRLELEEASALKAVLTADKDISAAYAAIQQFTAMVRKRCPESLANWISTIVDAGYFGLKGFANGLRQDFEEVRNALSLRWNNGACEGHVNRLKFLKRQMYGRAKFDLLRKRVLYRPDT